MTQEEVRTYIKESAEVHEFALESGQELYVDGKKIYTSDMEYVGEIE